MMQDSPMNTHAITLRLDDQAWSKLSHESRRTGILPGPLARSYVLAALADVELPPQDTLPVSSPPGGSVRSSNAKRKKRGR